MTVDKFYTPEKAVNILLKYISIEGSIFEPCCGNGAISNQLETSYSTVETNDIDPEIKSDYKFDASKEWCWSSKIWDWIITNPPDTYAAKILKYSYHHTRHGIAFNLPINFLEPCEDRKDFLFLFPISHLIVMPRMSYLENNRKDRKTRAWFVWDKRTYKQKITIVSE